MLQDHEGDQTTRRPGSRAQGPRELRDHEVDETRRREQGPQRGSNYDSYKTMTAGTTKAIRPRELRDHESRDHDSYKTTKGTRSREPPELRTGATKATGPRKGPREPRDHESYATPGAAAPDPRELRTQENLKGLRLRQQLKPPTVTAKQLREALRITLRHQESQGTQGGVYRVRVL